MNKSNIELIERGLQISVRKKKENDAYTFSR
jgi:hypothetical protein